MIEWEEKQYWKKRKINLSISDIDLHSYASINTFNITNVKNHSQMLKTL